MAMISCHECNKKVSDMAQACPECGSPVAAIVSALKVRIIYPSKAMTTLGKIDEAIDFSVIVADENGKEMIRLKPGEQYTFAIKEPMEISIKKTLAFGNPTTTVYPGDTYEIRKGMLNNLKLVKVS
jgi:hypothetical protein